MKSFDLNSGKRIHLIAVGGAVMHNLALALKQMGNNVTGSDDAFHDPSKSRLEKAGFDTTPGWDDARVDPSIDLVILGMHARKDNPELQKAQKLGLEIQSFPEFIGAIGAGKMRLSVAGSHGKTTTTSMIMHALRKLGKAHDYLVGAQLPGYETMVGISDAPVIVIESDEYLSSCLDLRPKMLHYQPQIAVITGLEWDHMNVFPTYASYRNAFLDFIRSLPEGAILFYDQEDAELVKMVLDSSFANAVPYTAYPAEYEGDRSVLKTGSGAFESGIFGRHNFANLRVAGLMLEQLGITEAAFLEAMQDFKGAQKRMQLVRDRDGVRIIQDFAHAPSKARSTVRAVRDRYPEEHLVAALELHTFSSLNPEFLPHYRNTMSGADTRIVLYDPASSDHKRLERLSPAAIKDAFADPGLIIVHDRQELIREINKIKAIPRSILLMSSGYWGGGKFEDLVTGLAAD